MAKIRGPLFSYSASGSMGPRLTYSMRASGPQVRHQKAQKDILTDARDTERGFFQEAAAMWGTLTTEQQQQWVDFNAG